MTTSNEQQRYGLPYQGSKNAIARWVVDNLPPADVLVDAFAGGCAITHAALLSGKFKRVIANDITDAPQLFYDAMHGKYRNETRWISRDEFHALKDRDPYVRLCWSFGNNGDGYLYGQHLEAYKKGYHYAAVFEDYSLWAAMGIVVPQWLRVKASNVEGQYDRKLLLQGWIREHNDEVEKRVKACYLQHIEERKERWQEMLGEVIDVKKIKAEEERLRGYLLQALKESGLTQSEVNRRLGTQMSSHYFGRSQWAFPTYEEYTKMQEFMPLKEDYFTITKFYTILKTLQSLESLESLQSLQSLQGLESLQDLQRLRSKLTVVRGDYAALPLPTDETYTLYCDPPYANTDCGHYGGFDHDRFYRWLQELPHAAIISEYAMPDGFTAVAACRKRVNSMGAGRKANDPANHATERLFTQTRYYGTLPKTTLF